LKTPTAHSLLTSRTQYQNSSNKESKSTYPETEKLNYEDLGSDQKKLADTENTKLEKMVVNRSQLYNITSSLLDLNYHSQDDVARTEMVFTACQA